METLRYVVLVNGLLVVVSLAYYVLLRRETFFSANRIALWLGVVSAFVLPMLELPDWRPQPVRTVMHRTAQAIVPKVFPNAAAPKPAVTITFPDGRTFPAFQQQASTGSWPWQYGLIGLYALGVILLACRFLVQYISLQKLIWQSVHEPYTDFTLVRNERITSPFSFFKWVVLNPDRHTPDELEQILRHERIHVRERHSLDMIGAEWLCILFWFNPAVYLFRHLLHQTLEFSADRAVLAEGVDAKLYQYNLLKVSLSEGQSALTNHFSKSQLTSRIVMLNKPASQKIIWLKYPVFFIAALTVASAFARPKHINALSKYLPKPITETIAAVIGPEEVSEPLVILKTPVKATKSKSISATGTEPKFPVVSLSDSTNSVRQSDSVWLSPCRYVVYKGDYLCWIITPKTSLDDLALIKQEMKKHGYTLQIREVRYHEDFDYIYSLDYRTFNFKGTGGGSTYPPSTDKKPICIPAGILGIGTKAGQSYGGASLVTKINPKTDKIPAELKRIAIEDSINLAEYIRNKRIESILKYSSYKSSKSNDSLQSFRREFVKTDSAHESGITILPNGYLAVNDDLKDVSVFINGESISREALGMWSFTQLYVVTKKSIYDSVKKELHTLALYIYVNKDI